MRVTLWWQNGYFHHHIIVYKMTFFHVYLSKFVFLKLCLNLLLFIKNNYNLIATSNKFLMIIGMQNIFTYRLCEIELNIVCFWALKDLLVSKLLPIPFYIKRIYYNSKRLIFLVYFYIFTRMKLFWTKTSLISLFSATMKK